MTGEDESAERRVSAEEKAEPEAGGVFRLRERREAAAPPPRLLPFPFAAFPDMLARRGPLEVRLFIVRASGPGQAPGSHA